MINSFCSGILTGIFMVSVIVVLSSNQKHPSKTFSKTYKQKLLDLENRLGMLEASVEEGFIIIGEKWGVSDLFISTFLWMGSVGVVLSPCEKIGIDRILGLFKAVSDFFSLRK